MPATQTTQTIIRAPITNASAWRGEDMARRSDWIIHLKPEHITEIEEIGRAHV